MNNLSYFIAKNKMKIMIVAVALTVVAIVLFIILRKTDDTKIGDNENDATVFVTPTITGSVDKNADVSVASNNKDEYVVLVSVTDYVNDSKNVYEVAFDKAKGKSLIYTNGECTGEESSLDYWVSGSEIFKINDEAEPIEVNELTYGALDDTYIGDVELASSVLKQYIIDGAVIMRVASTMDYIDIYFKTSDGTIKRLVAADNLILISDYTEQQLPDIDNYVLKK